VGIAPDAELVAVFEMTGEAINITVSAPSSTGHGPARDSFAWTVLSALAGDVSSAADGDNRITITLLKRRSGTAR